MVHQFSLLLLLVFFVLRCSSVRRNIGEDGEDDEDEKNKLGRNSNTSPVVFVSGLTGASLDVKVGSPWTSWRPGCNYPWWSKAFLTKNIFRYRPSCLRTNFRLKWDDKKKAGISDAGIQVQPHGGNHNGEALFPSGTNPYRTLFSTLEKDGRTFNKSLIAHPYDWRLSVRQWETTSFPSLKTDIEVAKKNSKNRRVVVVTLSMGGPYFHRFLQWVDDEWKREHVEAFVSIDGSFNGATSAVKSVFQGIVSSYVRNKYDSECPSCIPPRKNKTDEKGEKGIFDMIVGHLDDTTLDTFLSWPSMYFVMPKVDTSQTPPHDPTVIDFPDGIAHKLCLVNPSKKFTGSSCGASSTRDNYTIKEGFLTTNQCAECKWTRDNCSAGDGFEFARQWGPSFWRFYLCCKRHECETRSYRASELPSLFRRMGHRNMEAQMSQYALEQPTTSDPGVPVHCIYGSNWQTVSQVHLNSDFSLKGVVLAEGDGTVDGSSLRVCERWNSTVRAYAAPNLKHAGPVLFDETVDLIRAIARGDKPFWEAWKPPENDSWTGSNPRYIATPELRFVAK